MPDKKKQGRATTIDGYFYVSLCILAFSCFAIVFFATFLWILKAMDPTLLARSLEISGKHIPRARKAVSLTLSLYLVLAVGSGGSLVYCLSYLKKPRSLMIEHGEFSPVSSKDEYEEDEEEEELGQEGETIRLIYTSE